MTLGELIEELEKYPSNQVVAMGFSDPHSYRGDYSNLAFEPIENTTVGEMLSEAKDALGSRFEGYKGGEFKMTEYTDVYIAYYSHCGEELGPILLGYMLGKY